MQFLDILWLGMPVWIWLTFLGAVLAILAFDLGVMHRDSHEIGVGESLKMSALYIGVGLAWAGAVWWIYAHYADAGALDPQIAAAAPDERAWTAVELYLTGYLVEKTLAMDNVFIISMIFGYFAVPREYQHRVLFWGILGVIVLRAIMIGLGAALVMEFTWVMYLFGVVLLAARTDGEAEELDDYKGLGARDPLLALAMLVLMFSTAGVPPFGGFWAKLWIIQALLESGHLALAALAVLASVVGAYYYLRVVWYMYFEAGREQSPVPRQGIVRGALALNALAVLALGILPNALLAVCSNLFP